MRGRWGAAGEGRSATGARTSAQRAERRAPRPASACRVSRSGPAVPARAARAWGGGDEVVVTPWDAESGAGGLSPKLSSSSHAVAPCLRCAAWGSPTPNKSGSESPDPTTVCLAPWPCQRRSLPAPPQCSGPAGPPASAQSGASPRPASTWGQALSPAHLQQPGASWHTLACSSAHTTVTRPCTSDRHSLWQHCTGCRTHSPLATIKGG